MKINTIIKMGIALLFLASSGLGLANGQEVRSESAIDSDANAVVIPPLSSDEAINNQPPATTTNKDDKHPAADVVVGSGTIADHKKFVDPLQAELATPFSSSSSDEAIAIAIAIDMGINNQAIDMGINNQPPGTTATTTNKDNAARHDKHPTADDVLVDRVPAMNYDTALDEAKDTFDQWCHELAKLVDTLWAERATTKKKVESLTVELGKAQKESTLELFAVQSQLERAEMNLNNLTLLEDKCSKNLASKSKEIQKLNQENKELLEKLEEAKDRLQLYMDLWSNLYAEVHHAKFANHKYESALAKDEDDSMSWKDHLKYWKDRVLNYLIACFEEVEKAKQE